MSNYYMEESQADQQLKIEEYDSMLFENSIMKISDVAEFLRISQKTIYRMALRGDIPAIRVGKVYRFLMSDILQWAKKGGSHGNKI